MNPRKALQDEINALRSKIAAARALRTEKSAAHSGKNRRETPQRADEVPSTHETTPNNKQPIRGSEILNLLNPVENKAGMANKRDSEEWQTRYSSATERSTSIDNKQQQRSTKTDDALVNQSRWSESTTYSKDEHPAPAHQAPRPAERQTNTTEKNSATANSRNSDQWQTKYISSKAGSTSSKTSLLDKPLPPIPSVTEPAPPRAVVVRITQSLAKQRIVVVSKEAEHRAKAYSQLTGGSKGGEIVGMLKGTEKNAADANSRDSGSEAAHKLGMRATQLLHNAVTKIQPQGPDSIAQRSAVKNQDRARSRARQGR